MVLTTATSTLRVYQFRHDREILTVYLTEQSLRLILTGRGSRIRTYECRIQNPMP